MTSFHGQPARRLTSEFLTVDVLENAGPRIVRLSLHASPNLFAELPEVAVPTELGDYHLWGGHRLWHAPEAMPRSYIPDDDGATVTELPGGIGLQGKTEDRTGIRKRIEIRLAADRPAVTLVHTLTNHGVWPVELAPWSISQLRLGGIVIAPLPVENSDPHGLLPNRQFSFWPYTRLRDTRLHWDDDFLLFKANAALPPFKAGYFNRHGWLAYWIDGVLFRKSFPIHSGKVHPDGNCNAEIYCNDQFVELESLGPLSSISPGEQVQLSEVWELYDDLAQPFMDGVITRVSALV
mgnify:CR=1 FL=1